MSKNITLNIEGMSCANCAAFLENKFKKHPGVEDATVNLVAKRATVTANDSLDAKELIALTERLGYKAFPADYDEPILEEKRGNKDKIVLAFAIILTAPMIIGMILSFVGVHNSFTAILHNQWFQLIIATPVQFIIGARFYRSAVNSLSQKTANMDVLVALGTTAAYLLSIYNGFIAPIATAQGEMKPIYFESSATIITLILLGKYLEEGAKRKTTSAIQKLIKLRPKTATVLKTPNGDSWGDSAMVCTLRDMAALGCFVMQKGVWNGKRLMNAEYLETASSKLVDNNETSHYSAYHQGYGYQIWRVCGNGFAFVGMGDQLTVCFPEQDFVFACVSDNQGTNLIREMIFAGLEDSFVTKFSDRALPPNPAAQQRLQALLSSLQLYTAKGLTDSPLRARLNGKKYVCENNPMGITEFSFVFHNEKEGEFRYTNAQGKKTIAFGVNENRFGKFPQFGYANDYGRQVTTDGFLYDDAVSLAWLEENKLMLLVQVIDRYFGNMSATFYFKGDEAYALFSKTAEYFFMEYEGTLLARLTD